MSKRSLLGSHLFGRLLERKLAVSLSPAFQRRHDLAVQLVELLAQLRALFLQRRRLLLLLEVLLLPNVSRLVAFVLRLALHLLGALDELLSSALRLEALIAQSLQFRRQLLLCKSIQAH